MTIYKKNNKISTWLFICAFMVFTMVIIGGLTRLTDSGLSMTNWQPISGIFPPMSDIAWQDEFLSYKKSPEYIHINQGMDLDEFKSIFWLEYLHRLLGRITGFVFFLPFLYFLINKNLSSKLTKNLLFILALGGLQAIIGWFMVKSGLRDLPFVDPLWLAFHLLMALIIYSLILILAFKNSINIDKHYFYLEVKQKNMLYLFAFLLLLQIVLGALVAGNNAGLVYNTYPLMGDSFIASNIWFETPWYKNFIVNDGLVQFNHRSLAHILFIYGIFIIYSLWSKTLSTHAKYCMYGLLFFMILQMITGILTLILQVPIILASMHQAIAFIIFAITIYLIFLAKNNGYLEKVNNGYLS